MNRFFTALILTYMMGLTSVYAETSRNLASLATPSAFYTSSWTSLSSINDGEYHYTGDVSTYYWGTWSNSRPSTGWIEYDWTMPYNFTGCKIGFWTDKAGDNIGDNVPLPASYKVQYWTGSAWKDVTLVSGSSYTRNRLSANSFSFETVKTEKLRIWLTASTNGSTYGAFGMTEWEAWGYSETPMIGSKTQRVVLSQEKRYRTATVDLTGNNIPEGGVSVSLDKELPGVTFSPATISKTDLEAGATLSLTYDPTAEGAKTDQTSIIVKSADNSVSTSIPLMTSMDEGFEEVNGDMVYDPCFYSLDHITTWSTAPTIAYLSDGVDVKCGATCVKFLGTSGIEYRGNMSWVPGDYTIKGWIKTNGTFECGAWGNGASFTTKDSHVITVGGNSVNFLIDDTKGEWKEFSFDFTCVTGGLGGAWVNNDRSKTSKETYLDNLIIYRHDAPDTELTKEDGDYNITPVSFANVHFDDCFWTPRQKQNKEVSIPYFLQKCKDNGRMKNFERAAAALRGEDLATNGLGWWSSPNTFDDTDLYKVLEGMAYAYQIDKDPTLDQEMDEYIALIASAQEPDGYLYTARTAGQPGNYHSWVGPYRWVWDPNLSHELYDAGHMYEAAYAHYQATSKKNFLDIATKNADLLVNDYLENGCTYEPGHQIVEMGLAKLYRATGKTDYLRLAKYMLDLRGDKGTNRAEYSQTHEPVIYQDEAVGHAVRAAYMYSGMADVAVMGGVQPYQDAVDKIWDNVVSKKLYLTGGIGATHTLEAFLGNYDLPNQTAYNETCAAIANVYWNHRQFLTYGDAKYYDVLERTLYNGLISGIGMNGKSYFYPNPLSADGKYAFNSDNTLGRQSWFSCTCCLSNMTRFIASVPGYMYSLSPSLSGGEGDCIYINLYAQSTADIALSNGDTITLEQTTTYPWSGNVAIKVSSNSFPREGWDGVLALRIPGWSRNKPIASDLYTYTDDANSAKYSVKVNGVDVNAIANDKGYVVINRTWKEGDEVELSLDMSVHKVVANDKVTADTARIAFERGPLVYCIESPDNSNLNVNTASVNTNCKATIIEDTNITVASASDQQLTKLAKITVPGTITKSNVTTQVTLTAIPYYAWANRGNSTTMEVWINSKKPSADVNDDGQVDISDVNAIISVICNSLPTGEGWGEAADVNGDGQVDISDVNAVISEICGN